ncbi:MAG: beta-propeller domain-containing protein [Actinomycetota bacterium]
MTLRVMRMKRSGKTVLAMRRLSATLLLASTACSGGHAVVHPPAAWLSSDSPDLFNPRVSLVQTITHPSAQPELQTFANCDELMSYMTNEALDRVGPDGLPFQFIGHPIPIDGPPVPLAPTSVPPTLASVPAPAAPQFSTTNIQEEGVDEPDLVKNFGDHALVIASGKLRYIKLDAGVAHELGSFGLSSGYSDGSQLLASAHRALVISPTYGAPPGIRGTGWYWQAGTAIHVIDISDPTNLREVRTLFAEGQFISGRLVNGVARLVISSYEPSQIFFHYPSAQTARAKRVSRLLNPRMIRNLSLDNWLPHYAVVTREGKSTETYSGHLASCNEVSHPRVFSGFGMLSVMTIDPNEPTSRNTTSVIGEGSTVYSSANHMYVALTRWPDSAESFNPADVMTDVHEFDISDPQRATYLASGTIPGSLLDQYSMSERNGYLRIATTLGSSGASTNSVYVLKQEGPTLAPIGQVGNLGRGEGIYSVRFIDSFAYVVTFKRIDPLYVIDLRDPTNPIERGSLTIDGYSSYLHPVGDGLLLGIGQSASTNKTVPKVQVSLFDVTNPDSPKRLDVLRLSGTGYPYLNQDPHSFLYWPASKLAVFPISIYSFCQASTWTSGVRIENNKLQEAGHIQHGSNPYTSAVERSFVVGSILYTMSERGLMATDINSFAHKSFHVWS